jgi:hypothetical protein
MRVVRIALAAGVIAVTLGVVGIVVWQPFSPDVIPDRSGIGTAVVTPAATRTGGRAQVGDDSRALASDDTGADTNPLSTPIVRPVSYAPGPIAATGDLVALASTFDADSALAQIETLTGPPYLGRYPSSAGGRAAGEYLAGQFAAYGLQPAGDGGTFFQSFPVEYVALADVPHLAIERFDGTVVESYVPYRDFGAILRGYSGAGVAEGEAVWVNDCAREDFDLLDVVSKVVLCRDASIRDAQRNALEHGAAGLLLLTDPRQRPPDFGSTYRETWVSEPIPTFRVFPSVTQDLLLGSGRSEADLSSTFVPFPLLARVRMRVNTVGAESCPRAGCLARNVLGVLPGRDPQYNNQVVILGAHYDHLGQSPDGTVWAGANDNASGVAVMLEIAKRWHEQGYVPRRTVLFAAWDAEEMVGGSWARISCPSPNTWT